jgi:spore coat protein U-like protein
MRGPRLPCHRFAATLRTAAGIAGLLLAAAAHAGADCSVATGDVGFGVYDPTIATADDAVGTFTVVCVYVPPGGATSVSYSLQLSPGSSGTYSQRQLVAGASRLGYNLYLDAGRTQVLGSGVGGTWVIRNSVTVGPGVGNGRRTNAYSIYGRMPALQDALVGSYSDAIVATLTF